MCIHRESVRNPFFQKKIYGPWDVLSWKSITSALSPEIPGIAAVFGVAPSPLILLLPWDGVCFSCPLDHHHLSRDTGIWDHPAVMLSMFIHQHLQLQLPPKKYPQHQIQVSSSFPYVLWLWAGFSLTFSSRQVDFLGVSG